MEQSYRIKANVGEDQVVKTVLRQDVDMLEILSLKIKQEDVYKLHTSNYGIIVGRVLANEAVGVYNAKVSVFVGLDDIDAKNNEITQFYPFENLQSKDENGVRYNLLKDESNDDCFQEVGTFPNKRLVLDNDTMIEIFDKYWKYTTVTNSSGDYMIPCVPVGNQQIHVDIDLSDIGVLSQKPRDFIYKGYNETQFDNANQFKYDTNLDSLSQIITQNTSVYVYPFWGSEEVDQVAITRCDIQIAYKFEPTCVFFGSIVSDNFSNNIGHKCNPSKHIGYNKNLVAGEGTIEMIRKTPDGLVEEFQIQGNRLIDGDGVWCYQIPMNLDYVMTDEYGNIVPADGTKGIATRTCVRFRISMQETNNEGVSRHRARYLVPNVHQLVDDFNKTDVPKIADPSKLDQCYEFGSATPDEYFRDLYWNKVYTVKNYIPRLQRNGQKNTTKYSAIRSVNDNGNLNPFPFNHGRFRLHIGYRILCNILQIVFRIIQVLNTTLSEVSCFKFPIFGRVLKFICKRLAKCIPIRKGFIEDEDSKVEYFPGCNVSNNCPCAECEEKGCIKNKSYDDLMDVVQQQLAEQYEVVNLDFYNDWVNGTLYMPLWFWRKTKKKKFLFGLFSLKAVNTYCSCDKNYPSLRITENCSIPWIDTNSGGADSDSSNTSLHKQFSSNSPRTIYGIIKEIENKDGLKVYYYSPGVARVGNYREVTYETEYVRLYSTDIVLLGSLNECDLDNLPRPFLNLPSTSANIPYIKTLKQTLDADDEDSTLEDGETTSEGTVEVTGMDWERGDKNGKPKYGGGLFMDLDCGKVQTRPKTCINLSRMSELGVSLDVTVNLEKPEGNTLRYDTPQIADGMITRYELVDNETRAMFASLNHNGFLQKTHNKNTGYDTYLLEYMYPNDFDGRMKDAPYYTSMMEFKTYDISDQTYLDYRLGRVRRLDGDTYKRTASRFYGDKDFPLYDNSFYFYFGLHEGNTAIDKFNNLFYAVCHKNQKYPFSMTYTTSPAKWCKKNQIDNDYGTIDIEFKGIQLPYSYTLYNQFNEEIITESNVYHTELKFGYLIDDKGYTTTKHGYFTISSEPNGDVSGGTHVENGIYIIEVVDGNGSKLKQSFNLHQTSMSATINAVKLGDKFYSSTDEVGNVTPISKPHDFCDEKMDLYGEIRVEQIDIDGKPYIVSSLTETSVPSQYHLKLKGTENNSGNTEEVLLTLTIDGGKVEDCMCPNDSSSNPYILSNGVLSLHVWQPQNYRIHIVQVCDLNEGDGITEVNDNEFTTMITIPNGEPFNAYLNDVPLKFMMTSSLYNPNATSLKDLNGWMNLEKTQTYNWPTATINNYDTWRDFINIEVDEKEENNKVTSSLTLSSKLQILEYQLQSIFKMCNSAYILGDSTNTFSISATGGKPKILYRGNYPTYYNMSSDVTYENKYNEWIFDSDGAVTSNNSYPNIISENYTVYNSDVDYYIPLARWEKDWVSGKDKSGPFANGRAAFNPLYEKQSSLGNYFAVFTNNGGIVKNANGGCQSDQNNGYKSLPSASNPQPNICPGGYSDGESDVKDKNYYRTLFTDKRFDYDMIVWTPTYYGMNNTNITSGTWQNGRISGITYNGITMAYDKNYNIVGESSDNLEYIIDSVDEKSGFTKITYNTTKEESYGGFSRNFYKSELRLDNEVIDLVNDMVSMNDGTPRKCFIKEGETSTYPMRHLLHVPIEGVIGKQIVPSQKLKFSTTSCAYDVTVTTDITDDGVKFNAIVDPGTETSFVVDCRSQISVVSEGLSVMAQADKADLTYKEGKVDKVNFKFKIGQDGYNKTHRVVTYLPFFWEATKMEHLQTQIENLKRVYNFRSASHESSKNMWVGLYSDSTTPKGWDDIQNQNPHFMKLLVEYTHKKGNDRAHGTKDIWKNAEYDSSLKPVTDDIRCDTLNTDYRLHNWAEGTGDRVHHWVESEDTSKIVYDDDSRIKNIVYSVDRPSPVLGIVLLRQYINDEADNLSKNIMVVNTSAIFDFTKTISVSKGDKNTWMYSSTNLSGETSEGVVTSVTSGGISVNKDDEGNITGISGGRASAQTGNVETTTSSITSYANHIEIKVTTDDPGWSGSYVDGDGRNVSQNLEAVLVVEGKYHFTTAITSNGNVTTIAFDWVSANPQEMFGPTKPDESKSKTVNATLFVRLNDSKQKMVAKVPLSISWGWNSQTPTSKPADTNHNLTSFTVTLK